MEKIPQCDKADERTSNIQSPYFMENCGIKGKCMEGGNVSWQYPARATSGSHDVSVASWAWPLI